MATKRSAFGRDTGLQARMLLTMFLLGLVYAVLIGVLFASGARGVTLAVVAGALFLFQFFAADKLGLRAMGAREVTAKEELKARVRKLVREQQKLTQAAADKQRTSWLDNPTV